MNFFIHQVFIRLTKIGNIENIRSFDEVWQKAPVVFPGRGHAVWINPSEKEVKDFLVRAIQNAKAHPPCSITLAVKDRQGVKNFLKKAFPVIKAAGGIVRKGESLLFIYRRHHWDLPKGKIDKNESSKAAAVREIEEECQVKAACEDKIATTYHPFIPYGKQKIALKKTTWYSMHLLEDKNMRPQVEEDIEKVIWVAKAHIGRYLAQAYPSIRYLIERYQDMQKRYSASS